MSDESLVSRRSFLKALGIAGGAVALNGVFTRVAFSAGTPSGGLLVAVFLRGGMDALNAVVPAFETRYFDLRPTIRVPESQVLSLDGNFGLHPALAPLHPLFVNGDLAFVHACGNPDPSRSHFAAQRSMENASYQATSAAGGWIERHLGSGVSGGGSLFSGLAFSPTMPVSLQGGAPRLSMTSLDSFKLLANPVEAARYQAAMWSLYDGSPGPLAAGVTALGVLADAATVAAMPGSGVAYPSSPFGIALRDVGRLVRGSVGLQAVAVDVDNWDLHVDIGPPGSGALSKKLSDLAGSLAAFVTDLGAKFGQTTIVVMSEFGRRVAENGNGGTDHGHGGCMMVLGGGIQGGRVYGQWPGLGASALDRGDLAITTDYRDVLAEIVAGRLGNSNLEAVFPGYTPEPVGVI